MVATIRSVAPKGQGASMQDNPTTTTEETTEEIPCPACTGTGKVDGRDTYRGRDYDIKLRCWVCEGRGIVRVHRDD